MIDVNVDGVDYQEMHVDGGTIAQVFVFPPSVDLSPLNQSAPRRRVLYVIRNARLDSPWEHVPRKTMGIAARAIGSLTAAQGVGDLYRIFTATQRDGIEFNLAYIPPTLAPHGKEEFNTAYMRALYAAGKRLGEVGYVWHKYPPAYEKPMNADAQAK